MRRVLRGAGSLTYSTKVPDVAMCLTVPFFTELCVMFSLRVNALQV